MFTTQGTENFKKVVENKIEHSELSEDALVEKYQLHECIKWIRENNYERTCLQFPEELLDDGTSVALYIQKSLDKCVYLLGDTSYGSCCVDEVAAEHVMADSIIHFGHACLSPVIRLPVYYVFFKEDFDVQKLYCKVNELPKTSFVILFYDDVHNHLYPELKKVFKGDKDVSISSLNTLGCTNADDNTKILCGRIFTLPRNKNVSAIYIGEKKSVTLENLILNLPDVKWYLYSYNTDDLNEYEINRNRFLMKRMALVQKVIEAKTIGILIGTLGIKDYLDAIQRIKSLAKKRGKRCYKLAVGKPNVAKLANFPEIDVFVCIACQENALLKDFTGYYKPVVSLMEIEMGLGGRIYDLEYTSDFRELLPGGSFHKESGCPEDLDGDSKPGDSCQELIEKDPGTMVESSGAEFLLNRSWHGLEQRIGETDVCKAVKGRTGIPQAYENELTTLSEEKPS